MNSLAFIILPMHDTIGVEDYRNRQCDGGMKDKATSFLAQGL